jgi:tetratricopeptide (TPR) repeat protein
MRDEDVTLPPVRSPHLTRESARTLLEGGAGRARVVAQLFRHLLAHCPTCAAAWSQARAQARSVAAEQDYTAALEVAFGRAGLIRADLERELEQAPQLFARLVAEPPESQGELLLEDSSFHTWGVCDLLINESYRAVSEDPGAALGLAELAVQVAEKLDGARYGDAFLADVQAMAWAYLGNARRVLHDLRGAEEAIHRAEEWLAIGVGDPLCRGQVLSLKASLRQAEHRFDEAEALLSRALGLHRRAGDEHRVGLLLVQQAFGRTLQGRSEEALALLETALGKIDPERDPRLYACARHNRIDALIRLDWLAEAELALAELAAEEPRGATDRSRLQLRWLEARLAAALGEGALAEDLLLEVRRGFLELGLGYDVALVSLDLAAVYVARHDFERLRALVSDMGPIFRAPEVHREALAALAIFQQLVLVDMITLAAVQHVASFLRRARTVPGLALEPVGLAEGRGGSC